MRVIWYAHNDLRGVIVPCDCSWMFEVKFGVQPWIRCAVCTRRMRLVRPW